MAALQKAAINIQNQQLMSKFNIKSHIPNTLTCLNLVCGCFSTMSSLNGNLTLAAVWIVTAAIFDFCDGLSARLLKVTSEIGKELDSLSDVVSFGVAPTMIVYKWLTICYFQMTPAVQTNFVFLMSYAVFLVPALSAVRLARFNLDTRQTENFIGMPTPANALFLGFIPAAAEHVSILNIRPPFHQVLSEPWLPSSRRTDMPTNSRRLWVRRRLWV